MADYYVGMKQETFLAHNMRHIRRRERVFDCEGGYVSEYQWDDGSYPMEFKAQSIPYHLYRRTEGDKLIMSTRKLTTALWFIIVWLAPVDVYRVYPLIVPPPDYAGKGYPLSVRVPVRAVINLRVGRQCALVVSIDVHHKQVYIHTPVDLKGNLSPVGRPDGQPGPPYLKG